MQRAAFGQEIHTFQIDFLEHVNNGVYVQWMEIGRTRLLEAAGMRTHEIRKQSIAPLLVETHITYNAPCILGIMWMSGCPSGAIPPGSCNSAFSLSGLCRERGPDLGESPLL